MVDSVVFPLASSRLLPALPGTTLGAGFDGIEFDLRGAAWNDWEMPTPGSVDGKPGQFTKDITYIVNLVIDETKLRDVLGISASASFSSGATSASASLQVYQEADVTTYTAYLLVVCRVITSVQQLPKTTFSSRARSLWNSAPKDRRLSFVRSFGDRFVSGVVAGGEFVAALSITASSRDELSKIQADFEVSGASGGGSIDVNTLHQFCQRHYSKSVSVHKVGGDDSLPPTTIDGILTAAVNFPKEVTVEREKIYSFCTEYYSDRPEAGMDVDVRSRAAEDLLDELAIGFARVHELREAFAFARLNHVMYPPKPDKEYAQSLEAIDRVILQGRKVVGTVSEKRFQDLSGIHEPDLNSLPDEPVMLVGPLDLKLDTTWRPNGNDTEGADHWCGIPGTTGPQGTAGLDSFCISNVVLPPNHVLEYRPHLSMNGDTPPGETGWTQQGNSTPRGLIEGVYIRIAGAYAARYTVQYDVIATDGQQFLGRNGGLGGTTMNWLRLNRIKLSIRLN